MATVTFNPTAALPVFDMPAARLGFPALLNSYSEAILTPTLITLRSSASNRTLIQGTGLTFTSDDGNLVITGGIITQVTIRIGSASPTIIFADLNLDAEEFGVLLGSGSVNLYDLLLAGNDTIDGAGGNDVLKGFNGNDTLNGLGGNDTLHGDAGNDTLFGGDGNDTLNGSVGADTLTGDAGNDRLNGGDNADRLNGGAGNDVLNGDAGGDNLSGGDGLDILSGHAGNDTLAGDGGNDRLFGGDGNDTEYGGAGTDTLFGEIGSDTLFGGDGSDTLSGSSGNDTLYGGAGIDQMNGGIGIDVFVFNNALLPGNVDVISAFSHVDDTIRLENAVFLGLTAGGLGLAAFRANLSGNAGDASDRVIYERDTGKLFFDRDGSRPAFAKVEFADLDGGLPITNTDFFII